MDAMTQIAQVLGSMPTTHSERRREINRRYYERNREVWRWFNAIRKLRALRELLVGGKHANH